MKLYRVRRFRTKLDPNWVDFNDRENMIHFLLYRLQTGQATEICRDERYRYYNMIVNGHDLCFAKNRWRTDGLRLFFLNDDLAKVLGYSCYKEMRHYTPKLQHSRKMVSVWALKRHL